jgi:hypothetical protein
VIDPGKGTGDGARTGRDGVSIWTLTLLLAVSAIWVALVSAVAYLASATVAGDG